MKLYNTLTNTKEELKPIKEGTISMYCCGPTVYNYVHIGNVRNMVVFDVLRRTLEYQGYNVEQMVNFTDVDDKIIKRAKEEGVSEAEITEKYIKAYNDVRHGMHVLMPTYTPRVTENMGAIIDFIDDLVQKGSAYEVDGDVYFDVEHSKYYGELSKNTIEELKVGARVDENEKKHSPLDFALWKAMNEGLRWDSPWGMGRPGWHTECVVMIHNQFKGEIDIHMGGVDLKFPHHENEIAQSRALHGHAIAHTWIHNAMLNIDGEKMSKSMANGLLANDMIELHGGNVLRWMLMSTHYRLALNFTDEVMDNARKEIDKILTPLKQLAIKGQLADQTNNGEYNKEEMTDFINALNDDLNISNAMSIVYEKVKELNQLLRVREIDFVKAYDKANVLMKMLEILGIEVPSIVLTEEDKELYAKWNQAKSEKDFEAADTYRNQLIKRGVM
ncbi:MAG: cysteine--tRNA ligase [Erysipelotrichales bacterium]|nr:cysteine--tRNA ligase [Erysipelotrichales bacterium]